MVWHKLIKGYAAIFLLITYTCIELVYIISSKYRKLREEMVW